MRKNCITQFFAFTQYTEAIDLEMLLDEEYPGRGTFLTNQNMQTKNLKHELTEAGLKGTRSRLAVLEILQAQNRPLLASEILTELENADVTTDQATVYRILDVFAKKGLITRLEFLEGKFRYELTGQEHHHLICDSCGSITDFSDCNIAVLEQEIRAKKGFLTKRHSLEFFGVCLACQR